LKAAAARARSPILASKPPCVQEKELTITTAVNDDDDVFVTEYHTSAVVKLASGSTTQTVLQFTGLNSPSSVAVDKSGNVYVANRGDDEVLKLAP
jgi:DNA-binding beta-propeller fold protein YncE